MLHECAADVATPAIGDDDQVSDPAADAVAGRDPGQRVTALDDVGSSPGRLSRAWRSAGDHQALPDIDPRVPVQPGCACQHAHTDAITSRDADERITGPDGVGLLRSIGLLRSVCLLRSMCGRNTEAQPEKKDNKYCANPEDVIAYMNTLKEPWIAFKTLAAGAIRPKDAFRWCFESGADFICVGMYDFQLVEDVNLAYDILSGDIPRKRPWRA